jgi:formyltetrahydrofolate synthetase
MVATLRALKMHGSGTRVIPGKPFPAELYEPDLKSLEKGCLNLVKHIENAQGFGVPVIVALNRFGTDTDREIALVERIARDAGAEGAFVSDAYCRGGGGAISLAEAVVLASKKPSKFQFLYPLDLPVKAKIERIAEKMFGAGGVDYSRTAENKIKQYSALGFDRLPICMAKTHLSLSHDASQRGLPRRFRVPIQDVRLAAGAGYLIPVCGDIRPMPALPSVPVGTRVDIDENGRIVGLF